ncbi:MAG: hypothetical protein ACREBW_00195 [Candidatus Micrarchaeaceae archaeon]
MNKKTRVSDEFGLTSEERKLSPPDGWEFTGSELALKLLSRRESVAVVVDNYRKRYVKPIQAQNLALNLCMTALVSGLEAQDSEQISAALEVARESLGIVPSPYPPPPEWLRSKIPEIVARAA